MSEAQITTLTHHFAAQLFAVNAHSIIRAITHLFMAFILGFCVGANASIPEQIDWRGKNGANKLLRCKASFASSECDACFFADGDMFG